MKECDEKSKQKRAKTDEWEEINNVRYLGVETPIRNGCIEDKNILTFIWEADAKENEMDEVKDKFPEWREKIDIESWYYFSSGIGVGTLKCIRGFNNHGTRNCLINKGTITDKCSWCGQIED